MATQDDKKETGKYRISEGPITSSSLAAGVSDSTEIPFPAPSEVPCLFAIARDPRSLFVCWSVDWPTVFTNGLPPDRRAHVRLRSRGKTKTVGVEPTVGSYIIQDLDPGETYGVELGYYAPADLWHAIAIGNEVMMPFESEPLGDDVEVATIPLHLSFERMLNLVGDDSPARLAQTLARIQDRAAKSEDLTARENEILRALQLSREDLRKHASYGDSLARSEKIRDRSEELVEAIGASPRQGFAGSSRLSEFGGGS